MGKAEDSCITDTKLIENYIDGKVAIRTKFITQYFNIENYEELGSILDYIGLQENYFLVWASQAATLTYWVQQSVISVYSNRFFDLSNLSFFNYGDKFTTY